MSRNLFITNSLNIVRRNYSKRKEGGVLFSGITYYPRRTDQKDPEIEPAKLFRVQRIKPVKGNPYWEKRILKDLGLIDKEGDVAIVKNIPENNARLWKVKHLVKIAPITYPFGEPTEKDLHATYLKENGECIVHQDISVDQKRIQDTEDFQNDKLKLDGNTLNRDSRMKWLNPWT